MTVIIPTIEKYEVCDYTNKLRGPAISAMNREAVSTTLKNRKFTVIKTFEDIAYISKIGYDSIYRRYWIYCSVRV